ncbi:MAG: InlB B-repeat-containing protein [Bacilli bacterium]|nr:InlB B-repeat-containing protein [Bacilli bacterium]
MKKIFAIGVWSLLLSLTGCVNPSTEDMVCISYVNTDLENSYVKRNNIINEFLEPKKDGFCFCGWYTDSSFSNRFQLPIRCEDNISVYAKFIPSDLAYNQFVENTLNENNKGINIEYNLSASYTLDGKEFTGDSVGSFQYFYDNLEPINYLDSHKNTGNFFQKGYKKSGVINSKLISFLYDNSLNKKNYTESIFDEEKQLSFYNIFLQNVHKYQNIEISSQNEELCLGTLNENLALIECLEEYVESKILLDSIRTNYNKFGVSKLSIIFNNEKIEKFYIKTKLENNNSSLNIDYQFTIKEDLRQISDHELNNDDVYFTGTRFQEKKQFLIDSLDTLKSKNAYKYNYLLNTSVKFFSKDKNDLNLKVEGYSHNTTINNEKYYFNYYQLSSNYKDNDFYHDVGISDFTGAITRFRNKENHVLNVSDGTYVDLGEKTGRYSDGFYLLDTFNPRDITMFIYSDNDEKQTQIFTCNINFAEDSNVLGKSFLYKINEIFDFSFISDCNKSAKIFGEKVLTSPLYGSINIEFKDGEFSNLYLKIYSYTNAFLESSESYSSTCNAEIMLSLSIEVDESASSFSPPNSINDLDDFL